MSRITLFWLLCWFAIDTCRTLDKNIALDDETTQIFRISVEGVSAVCTMLDFQPDVLCSPVQWASGSPFVDLPKIPSEVQALHTQAIDSSYNLVTLETFHMQGATKEASTTTVPGQEGKDGPYFSLLFPEYAAVYSPIADGGTVALVADFEIVGLADLEDYTMVLEIPGQTPFRLSLPNNKLTLGNIEPGTHAMTIHVVRNRDLYEQQEIDVKQLRSPVKEFRLAFDTVLHPDDLHKHRWFPTVQSLLADAEQWAALPLLPQLPSTEKINLLFVGGFHWDGQKRLWIQQMQHLDRTVFNISYLTMAGETSGGSPLRDALEELYIPIVNAPLPSIDVSELEGFLNVGDDGELKMEPIINEMVRKLEQAEYDLNRLPPESWVQRLWAHCVKSIQAFSPKVLVYGNARDPTDTLLTISAQIAGARALVMELPNLYPSTPVLADAIIAPSNYAAKHESVLEATQGEIPIVVVTPGVDTSYFSPDYPKPMVCPHRGCPSHNSYSNQTDKGPGGKCSPVCVVVGFMARLSREKNVGLFISMAADIAKEWPFARFTIIGDGNLKEHLEDMAEYHGIRELVHFTGGIYEDLPAYLKGIDIMVNPSLRAWSETFCIANIEAMSMQIPIVSFGVGGIGEYLRSEPFNPWTAVQNVEGANGLLVDDMTPTGLGIAALYLMKNSTVRHRLGQEARRTVINKFELKDQMDKYQKVYSAVANSGIL